MGATKEMVIVNTTIEIQKDQVTDLDRFLNHNFNKVISYKIIPDTNELYNNNTHFKKLVTNVKKAQVERDKYINKHN